NSQRAQLQRHTALYGRGDDAERLRGHHPWRARRYSRRAFCGARGGPLGSPHGRICGLHLEGSGWLRSSRAHALGPARPVFRARPGEAGLMPASFGDFFFTYQALIYGLGVNGLLALSMYAVLAIGQLSLGQAAFMGIGAYVSALLTVKLEVPFAAALLAGMLAPALAAALIGVPTLRLSGVYLALATIGLGEVLRIFYLNSETA